MACSCVDCPAACPPDKKFEIESKDRFMIGKFNGYGVIVAIIVIFITIIAGCITFVITLLKKCKKGINNRKIDL